MREKGRKVWGEVEIKGKMCTQCFQQELTFFLKTEDIYRHRGKERQICTPEHSCTHPQQKIRRDIGYNKGKRNLNYVYTFSKIFFRFSHVS